jgi:imidazoleglycerol-phosphate dehydratase
MKKRHAKIVRQTKETNILLYLKVEGNGRSQVATGIPFFDHMLTLLAKHALLDLELGVEGDLEVDFHHTVEDTGIALGQALAEATGDKTGMRRYGFWLLPMDETLVRVALDFSGRPLLILKYPPSIKRQLMRLQAGDFPAQLVEEFLRGLVQHAGLTLHIEVLATAETHHMIEAIFKGLARALEMALQRDPRVKGIPSTKGSLRG